jgi:hypothetical protein
MRASVGAATGWGPRALRVQHSARERERLTDPFACVADADGALERRCATQKQDGVAGRPPLARCVPLLDHLSVLCAGGVLPHPGAASFPLRPRQTTRSCSARDRRRRRRRTTLVRQARLEGLHSRHLGRQPKRSVLSLKFWEYTL